MKFEKYVYCFINDGNKKTCGFKTEVPLILMDFAFYLKKKNIKKRIPIFPTTLLSHVGSFQ